MERLWVQGCPGSEGDVGVIETLAVDELVSIEWSEVQDDDSDSCGNTKTTEKVTNVYTQWNLFNEQMDL